VKTILAGAAVLALVCFVGSAGATGGKRSGRAAVNALDVSWLHTSLEGDKFEIIGGKMAQQHSFDPVIRALGRRLVRDHSKSYADGAKVARQVGVVVPTEPTPSEGWELRMLSHAWGVRFDRMYATLEVADHHQDIDETSDEIERGWNAAVVGEAKKDLPVLKLHLALSRRAQLSVSS
jgi:putative membrane protein